MYRYGRFAQPCFLLFISLFFCLAIPANPQKAPAAVSSGQEMVLRAGVEEVRIDAVVVDGKGRQVTDLTPEDFEINQDGLPQKVISSTYIRTWEASSEKNAGLVKDHETRGPGSTDQTPSRTDPRIIAFLVDDLTMEMPDIYRARMSLQKFVEKQMQPGDLVSIIQTTGGTAGMQPFTSDRRELLSRIARIRWNPQMSRPSSIPQIMAIDYHVRALRSIPGRKFLMVLSTQVMLGDELSKDPIFDRLADEALRAGVVIHTLDILGLMVDSGVRVDHGDYAEIVPMTAESSPYEDPAMKRLRRPNTAEKQAQQSKRRLKNQPIPLSAKTGGLFLTGRNFFVNGIGDAQEEMKGYYLLSYIPPSGTFGDDNVRAFHKVKVKVKRPGLEVRSRDGFFGNPAVEPHGPGPSVFEAMLSPFQNQDLKVNLAAGYIHDSQKGYIVKAWMHVDGSNIGVVQNADGSKAVALDAAATTSDIDGLSKDVGSQKIRYAVSDKELESIRENGVRIALSLPFKKAGAYYLRAAVRDVATGSMGTAYQYLDIPDASKNDLSLSSIFVINSEEDASWINTGNSEDVQAQSKSSDQRQSTRRGQALRRYKPGENLDFMAVVSMPKLQKESGSSLETQSVIYSDGIEILRSKPESMNPAGRSTIPVRRRLHLDWSFPAGHYVLQLTVVEKRGEKHKTAVQTLNFEIESNRQGPAPDIASDAESAGPKKTVIEMSPEELVRAFPAELSKVKFEANQDSLNTLLQKVGGNVVEFFRYFPKTSAKERVYMQRYVPTLQGMSKSQPPILPPQSSPYMIQPIHTIMSREHSAEFNYIIMPDSKESGLAWTEDRADRKGRELNPKEFDGFIMSTGHAGKCLYFHPAHQQNSDFRYLGREESKKGHPYIIAFAQKIQSEDYLAQFTGSREHPPIRILVQGFAWIDPESYQILRMLTNLLMTEVSSQLRETITDIVYGKVRFESNGREFRLPEEINVSWEILLAGTRSVIYRNRHLYSDYHLFTVDTDYEINLQKTGND